MIFVVSVAVAIWALLRQGPDATTYRPFAPEWSEAWWDSAETLGAPWTS